LLRVLQKPSEFLVIRGDSRPTFGGGVPAIIVNRHVDASVDEELHGFVVLVPHQFMQDAGRFMRAPVRIDVGAMREKKVGDFELIVHDRPCERGVENPLRIGRLAEPFNVIPAVMGVGKWIVICEVAQCRFALCVEPTSHTS